MYKEKCYYHSFPDVLFTATFHECHENNPSFYPCYYSASITGQVASYLDILTVIKLK